MLLNLPDHETMLVYEALQLMMIAGDIHEVDDAYETQLKVGDKTPLELHDIKIILRGFEESLMEKPDWNTPSYSEYQNNLSVMIQIVNKWRKHAQKGH